MKHKPAIAVAIPAYNEAENIGNILDGLLKQKITRFMLEKIVVYTDGSTDQTVSIVKAKMRTSAKIQLVRGKKQRGKFYRLNRIFRANTADVLICLDADIGLNGERFLENFAAAVIDDDRALVVSAHEIPLLARDFIGRSIASTYLMWDYVRLCIPDRDHVQNLYARATAYRGGSFTRSLHIPSKATEERMYLYLMGKKAGGYRYTTNASIYYWPVTTIYDYIRLSERAFGRPQPAVNKVFGFDATPLYLIPRKYKLIGMLRSFLHDPFFTPIGLAMGYILSKRTLQRKTLDSAIWEVSLSSKKLIG